MHHSLFVLTSDLWWLIAQFMNDVDFNQWQNVCQYTSQCLQRNYRYEWKTTMYASLSVLHDIAQHQSPLQKSSIVISRWKIDYYHMLSSYSILRDTTTWSKIKQLTINDRLDRVDNWVWPPQLQSLSLGGGFDFPVDNLPETLLDLSLGDVFNQFVDYLPPHLQTLTIGYHFNRPIDHLPPHLKKLQLGWMFNQSVDHLPSTLESLSLHYLFLQSLDYLPSGLHYLSLNVKAIVRPLDHLPESLHELRVCGKFQIPLDHLPPHLTKLSIHTNHHFGHALDYLPRSLQTLKLYGDFNTLDHLPPFLTDFWLHGYFDQPLDYLPQQCLQHLELEVNGFHHRLDYLPQQCLLTLRLGDEFSSFGHSLDHLPLSLRSLSLHSVFNGSLNYLPPNLLYLRINGSFGHKLYHLPHSLLKLKMLGKSNIPWPMHHLPIELQELCYSGGIRDVHVPPYLHTLRCDDHDPRDNIKRFDSVHEATISNLQTWEKLWRFLPQVRHLCLQDHRGWAPHLQSQFTELETLRVESTVFEQPIVHWPLYLHYMLTCNLKICIMLPPHLGHNDCYCQTQDWL
jgi:hypothetical protein